MKTKERFRGERVTPRQRLWSEPLTSLEDKTPVCLDVHMTISFSVRTIIVGPPLMEGKD